MREEEGEGRERLGMREGRQEPCHCPEGYREKLGCLGEEEGKGGRALFQGDRMLFSQYTYI